MKIKNLKQHISYLFLLLLIIGTVFILQRNKQEREQTDSGRIFGTLFQIRYYSVENYRNDIMETLNRVNSSMSLFNSSSTLSCINNNKSTLTDSLFREVYKRGKEIAIETNGSFDYTVAPLVNAWGFGFKHDNIPTKTQIDSIMPYIGFEKISMKDGHIIKENPHIMIDFGAIAKGYAVDCVAHLLEEKGIRDYMVDIGGEVRVNGYKRQNGIQRQWTIGLEKPLEKEDQLQTILQLKNEAVATSGNYRNYYYHNGKKYAHTISPKSGYPVTHSLLSATVVAPECITADALATAFMVMGTDATKEYLKKHKEIQAYLIYDDKGTMKTWQNLHNIVEGKKKINFKHVS